MPLVSIITPARNAAATIAAAIAGVQAQSFSDWEMIIVDDGSSDGTGSIVADFSADDSRIRLIQRSEGGKGPAAARNRALSTANGQYIAFLDADDFWLPEKLSRQIAFMREHNAAICATAYRRMRENGHVGKILTGPSRVTFETLLKNTCVGTLTAVIDRSRTGPFLLRENFQGRDDLALWLTLTKQGHDILFLNEDLARYRVTSGSHSGKWLRSGMWTWAVYRQAAKLPPAQAAWSLFNYALRAAWKRIF